MNEEIYSNEQREKKIYMLFTRYYHHLLYCFISYIVSSDDVITIIFIFFLSFFLLNIEIIIIKNWFDIDTHTHKKKKVNPCRIGHTYVFKIHSFFIQCIFYHLPKRWFMIFLKMNTFQYLYLSLFFHSFFFSHSCFLCIYDLNQQKKTIMCMCFIESIFIKKERKREIHMFQSK